MRKLLVASLLAGSAAFAAPPSPEVYSAEDPSAAPAHPDMNITRLEDRKALPGIPLTGRIFTDAFVPIRDVDQSSFRQLSTSLWLEGNPQLNESSSGVFTLQADLFENGTTASTLRALIREGYVRYAKSGLELRAGRQIVPWGSSDAINPTDFLSAKDYTFFNPDDEVRRLGHTSLLAAWTPASGSSPWTITAVWTPVAPQSRLLINPSSVPAGIALAGAARSQPQTFSNSETAIRASYQGVGWDGAITAFRGWTHMPHFQLELPVATIFQTFQRRRALGLDGSFTTGKWVLRSETAYNWTENDSGTNPILQPSHLDLVAGAERPIWGDDLRAQAQFLWRYHPHFIESASAGPLAPLAAANSLVLGWQYRSRAGATLRLSLAPEGEDWAGELFAIANFDGGDYLLRPKLTYAFTQALKGTLGVEYYGGPLSRPLGALQVFNSGFAEAKYTF